MKAELKEVSQAATVLDTKDDNKWYDVPLRKCLYTCLLNQAPVDKASEIIKYIMKTLTGITLTETPSKSTTSQMVLEISIMCDIQVAEALLEEKNVTLAWDATSLDGEHINEVHVLTSKGPLLLQIGHVAGGT